MHQDVDLMRGMGNAIRTYSAQGGTAQVVEYAHEHGLRVSVGARLGSEQTAEGYAANQQEIAALVAVANQFPVESVVVGNEVLWRKDLSPQRLIEYVRQVQAGLKRPVPVATADTASMLLLPENRAVVEAVDTLLVNIYPYWSGVGIEQAARYVADVFSATRSVVGKPAVVGATGWPSSGPILERAIPSSINANRFIREWGEVAAHEHIDYFHTAAFDEAWRQDGGSGAHWGIWDTGRHAKYPVKTLLPESRRASRSGAAGGTARAAGTGAGAAESGAGTDPLFGSGPRTVTGARDSLVLYQTWPAGNEYAPTGLMGDTQDLSMTMCSATGRRASPGNSLSDYAIRVDYRPSGSLGWAGLYWQGPAHNWGDLADGGLDLQGLTALSFYARGERGEEALTFFAGGLEGPYGDTLTRHAIDVTLGPDWRHYTINIRGGDLSRVVGAFGWRANNNDNPNGARFYVDDIRFDRPYSRADRGR